MEFRGWGLVGVAVGAALLGAVVAARRQPEAPRPDAEFRRVLRLVGERAATGDATASADERAARGLVDQLGDPWAVLLTPAQHRRYVDSVGRLRSVSAARLVAPGVGYVRLERIGAQAAAELGAAFEQLRGAGSGRWILDLRGNRGGFLDQGIAAAGLLLAPGQPVLQVRERGQRPLRWTARRQDVLRGAPLLVLVDARTASAAEILAAALQDDGRALLVGAPTFGKGLVQSMFTLTGGWGLRLTTGHWRSPGGRQLTLGRGLAPDVATRAPAGADEDPALAVALDLLGAEPAGARALAAATPAPAGAPPRTSASRPASPR